MRYISEKADRKVSENRIVMLIRGGRVTKGMLAEELDLRLVNGYGWSEPDYASKAPVYEKKDVTITLYSSAVQVYKHSTGDNLMVPYEAISYVSIEEAGSSLMFIVKDKSGLSMDMMIQ